MLPNNFSMKRRLYNAYKASASRRNHVFNLNFSHLIDLTSSLCFYCKAQPSKIMTTKRTSAIYLYNGIDRLDNSKGYEKDNCVSCCTHCNTIKGTITIMMMRKIIEKIDEGVC
jgi:hypothetical protein